MNNIITQFIAIDFDQGAVKALKRLNHIIASIRVLIKYVKDHRYEIFEVYVFIYDLKKEVS